MPSVFADASARADADCDYLPLSFDAGFVASLPVELLVEALDDELGDDGDGAPDALDDEELGGAMEAVELGVDDVSVEDDEELVDGGVDGIDGVVVLDELLVDGGVAGAASCFCWHAPSAARTATAAAVIMNRFIMAPFCN